MNALEQWLYECILEDGHFEDGVTNPHTGEMFCMVVENISQEIKYECQRTDQ